MLIMARVLFNYNFADMFIITLFFLATAVAPSWSYYSVGRILLYSSGLAFFRLLVLFIVVVSNLQGHLTGLVLFTGPIIVWATILIFKDKERYSSIVNYRDYYSVFRAHRNLILKSFLMRSTQTFIVSLPIVVASNILAGSDFNNLYIANRFYDAAKSMLAPIPLALYRVKALNKGHKTIGLSVGVVIAVLGVIFTNYYGTLIIKLTFGSELIKSAELLNVLIMGCVPVVVSGFLSYTYILRHGQILSATLLQLATSVGLFAWIYYAIDPLSIAYGIVITEICVLLGCVTLAFRIKFR
jgi:hypothetical protein